MVLDGPSPYRLMESAILSNHSIAYEVVEMVLLVSFTVNECLIIHRSVVKLKFESHLICCLSSKRLTTQTLTLLFCETCIPVFSSHQMKEITLLPGFELNLTKENGNCQVQTTNFPVELNNLDDSLSHSANWTLQPLSIFY
jgi:hypothetical protein